MDAFWRVAEQRINEAVQRGELDNVEGRGKCLDLDDYFRTPAELRMAYQILKNADCLPPELDTKNEILRLEDLLRTMPDERERLKAMRRLNFLVTKLNVMRRGRVDLEENQRYYTEVVSRLVREKTPATPSDPESGRSK